MPDKLKDYLTSAKEKSIIMIHNHPNSSPLSTDDYVTSTKYASLFEVIASGHNGDVYAFRDTSALRGLSMKKDSDKMDFDDREASEDLLLDLSPEEIDRLYDETFGKTAQQ
ncbi:MAG TPA: hypothetical protein PLH83_03065 [Ruminococcus sp.]|nr:hypothetical protein [Ruminococcus sp.]